MNVDIIMPTCKNLEECASKINAIKKTRLTSGNFIYTGFKESASINRNYGLNKSTSEYIIMVDDDIVDYFYGWDKLLLDCLLETNSIVVSARLINTDGSTQCTCSGNYDLSTKYTEVAKMDDAFVPTACVCFKNTNIRFDTNFIGSGFEDTDFFKQLVISTGNNKIVINNDCKLTHINEAKNQTGKYWEYNKNYFYKKWNLA